MMDITHPPFLVDVEHKRYLHWLKGRAQAHFKRDNGRGHQDVAFEHYVGLIHEAVLASNGLDYYTGQPMDWSLIGTWSNKESKAGRHAYKQKYDRMPTVDHEEAGATSATFRICSWATNDSKHAMSTQDFIQMAKAILEHAGWTVTPPQS